ncbi:MAG: AAA family ATPase [Acidobacteriota bacterium]
MSKRIASKDEPSKLRLVRDNESTTLSGNSSMDLQSFTLARLYKAENISERFVGRADELAKLKRWFDQALAGHGKPVFIIGDPGIGKTELVRQFFLRLKDIAKISLTGRYFDIASGAPYKVFLDSLHDLVRHLEQTFAHEQSPFQASELAALQSYLKEIHNISVNPVVQGTDGERIKYNTFELLTRSYRLLAHWLPVILFLDDLQWADELSLEFLAYLIRTVQGERFFIVCTVREHEINIEQNPLRIWMRRMSRYNAYEQLKMQPLSEDEIEALIDSLFVQHAFIDNLVSLLRRETGGNPYYLLEIIKQLIEDRKIFWNGERWESLPLDEVRLPKSLVDLTELHLSHLDEQVLEIFEQAAVIGDEFSFTLLQSVTDLSEEVLLNAIEKGVREFLIREEPRSLSDASERYTFYYNTTRKVLYERLTSRQRRIIHLKAAHLLESANERRSAERSSSDLAYHYFHAGEMGRAFQWSVEAATVACQRFAFDRAKKFFDWAAKSLQTLEQANQSPSSQLLAKYYFIYGQLHNALGEYEAAVELLRRAQAVCREVGEQQKEAEVLLLIAECLKHNSSFTEALEAYTQALNLANTLSAFQLRALASYGAARCEVELGHPQAAVTLLQNGIATLEYLIKNSSQDQQEQLAGTRAEMALLLSELEIKIEKSVSERQSGSFPSMDAQVCESSTPQDRASRVIEVVESPQEIFKQYALWFKQLHGTNEILNKLSKSQLDPPRVVGLIFGGLKQLKGRINNTDPIAVNSQLSLIEKQLQEYQRWLQQINDMLPPYTIRQYLDQGLLYPEEMLQLARFMVLVQSESSDDKGKLELLLTRALELEVDRHQIINGLFPPELVFTQLLPDHPQLRQIESMLVEIENIANYSDLIASDMTQRLRQVKSELGQLFWHPQILAVIIEIDLKLDLRFKELLEQEQREIGAICERLLKEGVKMIPRRGQAGALDIEAARRMIERAKDLLSTNYESNRSGLMMLAEVGRLLRTHLQEQRILMAGSPELASPFRETEPAPPAKRLPPEITGTHKALPTAPLTTPSTSQLPNLSAQRQETASGNYPIPKLFVNVPTDQTAAEAATSPTDNSGVRGPANEQIEAKLQSRLAEICILLATKLRNVPVKVLQLKRSQLAIASWEVEALLASEDDPAEPTVSKQNQMIRRAIALLAEMQEIGITCRELLSAGQRVEASLALATAEYFLEQAKSVAGSLETNSHRERDAGEYTKAQNLAATRQKLMSTHQLLATLLGWLKREMDK